MSRSLEARIEALTRATASWPPPDSGPEALLTRLAAERLTPDEVVGRLFPLVAAEMRALLSTWMMALGPIEDSRDCGFWPVGGLMTAPFILRTPPDRPLLESHWIASMELASTWEHWLTTALTMKEGPRRTEQYRDSITDGLTWLLFGDVEVVPVRELLHAREIAASGPWSEAELQLPTIEHRRFNAQIHEIFFGRNPFGSHVPLARGQARRPGFEYYFLRGSTAVLDDPDAWAYDPAEIERRSGLQQRTTADIPVQAPAGIVRSVPHALGRQDR